MNVKEQLNPAQSGKQQAVYDANGVMILSSGASDCDANTERPAVVVSDWGCYCEAR